MSDTAQKRDVVEALRSLLAHRTEDLGCYEFVLEAWIESAADEIERLRAGRRWIPVIERLPPVDEKVLYTCFTEGDGPEDYFTQVNAGYWDGKARNLPGNPAMKYDDSNDWEPCSHWMPLPEPPEVK